MTNKRINTVKITVRYGVYECCHELLVNLACKMLSETAWNLNQESWLIIDIVDERLRKFRLKVTHGRVSNDLPFLYCAGALGRMYYVCK